MAIGPIDHSETNTGRPNSTSERDVQTQPRRGVSPERAVPGLSRKRCSVTVCFFLALSGPGAPEALATFTTNPAGAAIVNTVGPIRQIIRGNAPSPARTLVIISGTPAHPGERVQHQAP